MGQHWNHCYTESDLFLMVGIKYSSRRAFPGMVRILYLNLFTLLLFTLAEVTRVLFTFGLFLSGRMISRLRHNQMQLVYWINSLSCIVLVILSVSVLRVSVSLLMVDL